MAISNVVDVSSKKRGRVGRKINVFNMEALNAIPIEKGTIIRSIANEIKMGHSQVYRMLKAEDLRSHTNSIKPKLSHEHKLKRLNFILSEIILPTVNTLPKFTLMYNVVHIDEKWFFMSRETQRFYLFSWEEEEPYRFVQNKNFIGKVMFIASAARPIVNTDGDILWDGKIGIFPFIETQLALRSSSNKPAANGVRDIWIQQDNARPHILTDDHASNKAATQDGFNIRLVCQPASSPDMNILDLSLFNALQSIQFREFPKDSPALIKSVIDAYDTFNPRLLNYSWIQYQLCMLKVLKVRGGSNYKQPHIGKKRLDRLRELPSQLEVPLELIDSAHQVLCHGIINLNGLPQDED
ncbi:uncharacterized protein LOC130828588 [Amaranthus tricolor]|uniref:uncharacterized protein LOC130828588 n=1 Tax=Amaranthus tricolor TaxID=29722 RepID=UPI00258311A9|nr:uncharacterized protein LOC130828588 [Amaranthus tricolor]